MLRDLVHIRLCGLGVLVVVLGGCGASAPTVAAPSSTAPPAPSSDPAAPPCADAYTGDGTCTGAIVTVTRVLDPATVALADGRVVRLAGVAAVAAQSCAGPAALDAVSRALIGKSVGLLRPASLGVDEFGHLWGYLTTATGDLGLTLAHAGWATGYGVAPVAAGYARQVASAVSVARAATVGQFSAACAPRAPSVPAPHVARPAPRPRVAPAPDPAPDRDEPDPRPRDEGDSGSTRERGHTGQTGHPCGPGERDGDHDGYCGEGR